MTVVKYVHQVALNMRWLMLTDHVFLVCVSQWSHVSTGFHFCVWHTWMFVVWSTKRLILSVIKHVNMWMLCVSMRHIWTHVTLLLLICKGLMMHILYLDKIDLMAGGVLVLVHINLRPRHILTTTDIEVVVLQLSLPDMHLYVMSVYTSPHYFAVNCTNEMSKLLGQYNDKRICVIGDVNDDVSSNGIYSNSSLHNSA